jgi:hypothetical protein
MHVISRVTPEKVSLMLPVSIVTDLPGCYNAPLSEAKLSSDEFAERLFHIGMAWNRDFFAGPGIRVKVVLLAMSLQITAGLDQLTDKFTSPHTSNPISLV